MMEMDGRRRRQQERRKRNSVAKAEGASSGAVAIESPSPTSPLNVKEVPATGAVARGSGGPRLQLRSQQRSPQRSTR